MVQLGLLGLQVLPEGLLQCRTQQWNSSVSTNRGVGVGGVGGGGGGKRVGGGGCRERKTEVEGGGGMHWGKNREGVGLRGTNHITSLLLTSPRAATKGGTLSCLLYSVGLACFLSPRREKDGEQRVRSLHCSSPPHTQRKTDHHSCKNKIKNPKNSSTRKQTENFKNQNKRKKTRLKQLK